MLCAGLLALAGCDSASEDATFDAADGSEAASKAFQGDNSEFDGQPIPLMTAQAFVGDGYAGQVRAAIAARGQAVVTALPQSGSDYITLKAVLDKADQINGSVGAAPVSTHFEVSVGAESQQYLLAYAPAGTGGTGISGTVSAAHAYIVLDPSLFHPDASGEETFPRDVPATRLSDGARALVTLREDGFSVDGDAAGQLLVFEAVPVIDQYNGGFTRGAGDGDSSGEVGGAERATSRTFLALRDLRIDRSFDGGGISGKNEVQFTAQRTDNYALEFPRPNTRRFDNAFWTLSSDNPEGSSSNTLNEVPITAAVSWWFRAADVNYAGPIYPFGAGFFYECVEGRTFPSRCEIFNQPHDFPLIMLSSAYDRAYVSEDDWKVDRLSRRDGDWEGDIRTINFSTGSFQVLNTKLDANNHCCISSDAAFTQSGIRRVSTTTVNLRTNNGSSVYTTDSNGFRYSFTKQVITT